MPYTPSYYTSTSASYVKDTTYIAYGYVNHEINLLVSICKKLFTVRSVWIYKDLWEAVQNGVVTGSNFNEKMYTEGNFAIALSRLGKFLVNSSPVVVVKKGEYYILSPIDSKGMPVIDFESYIREFGTKTYTKQKIIISSIATDNTKDRLFNSLVIDLNSVSDTDRLEFFLTNFSYDFHITLMQKLIAGMTVTNKDAELIDIYKRYKIMLTLNDIKKTKKFPVNAAQLGNTIAGYVDYASVFIYNFENGTWINLQLSDFRIGSRQNENNIVIGITQDNKLKIRPPIHVLKKELKGDLRFLSRGAVCDTKGKEELREYFTKLRRELTTTGLAESFASRVAEKKYPSTTEVCMSIKLSLLKLEEQSRSESMNDSVRWLYLFNEKSPSLASIGTSQ